MLCKALVFVLDLVTKLLGEMDETEMNFKKVIAAIFALKKFFLTLLFLGFVSSNAYAIVTLEIGDVSGDTGQFVNLPVSMVNPADSIAGITLRIVYDPDALNPLAVNATARTLVFTQIGNQWVATYPEPGVIRLFAVSWRGDYVSPGTGPFATIRFQILSEAPGGDSPVEFENLVEADNSLSDLQANSIIPTLVSGYVTIFGPGGDNNPPVINSVSNQFASEGVMLQFVVSATDSDGDNIILNAQDLPSGASFPQVEDSASVQGTFSWTPTSIHVGNTYNVGFTAHDGQEQASITVVIQVTGGGGGQAPVIIAPSGQEVGEGDHLEFVVRATDPQGDFINLSASNLPENALFAGAQGYGVVSDTFYFDPDYDQGPSTYTVIFIASDNSGNTSQAQVAIIVNNAINDIIEVAPRQGALPGSLGRDFFINLRNPLPVYGLQFDLLFDSEILEIQDVTSDSVRAFDFEMLDTLMEDGRYRVIILPMNLETIDAGTGQIVSFSVDVDPDAETGPYPVSFDSATTVHDSAGTAVELFFEEGTFTVDILGDANLDGVINVGDCVAVIAHMIGRLPMNIRAKDAADFNRDGDVRISDLQGILYRILGRPFGPPPLMKNAGTIELAREDIYPGYHGELPLQLVLNTKAGGVQFTIDYDPSQVLINGLSAGNMVSDLVLDYNDNGEQIKGVIYDFGLDEFGPAIGELVTLDIEINNAADNLSNALKLIDFEIVTVDAHKLNVEVLGELPETYQLNQNYPNPFNIKTLISFDMPYSSTVRMDIYNVLGQLVKELYDGYLDAGSHQLIWDGSNSGGDKVTSGIYFYRFQAEKFDKTMKMLLVK